MMNWMRLSGAKERLKRWNQNRILRRELRREVTCNRRRDKQAVWLQTWLQNRASKCAPPKRKFYHPARVAKAVVCQWRKRAPRSYRKMDWLRCRLVQVLTLGLLRFSLNMWLRRSSSGR